MFSAKSAAKPSARCIAPHRTVLAGNCFFFSSSNIDVWLVDIDENGSNLHVKMNASVLLTSRLPENLAPAPAVVAERATACIPAVSMRTLGFLAFALSFVCLLPLLDVRPKSNILEVSPRNGLREHAQSKSKKSIPLRVALHDQLHLHKFLHGLFMTVGFP